jgi:Fe2+ or Zn2+ uptake regulation protein
MPFKRFILYVDFICEKFNKLKREEIITILKNYDLLCYLLDKEIKPISEIKKDIGKCKETIRAKLLSLEKLDLIKSERINRKKFYKTNVSKNTIDKFEVFCFCINCGKVIDSRGGIIHVNVESDYKFKVFCSNDCRMEYMKWMRMINKHSEKNG